MTRKHYLTFAGLFAALTCAGFVTASLIPVCGPAVTKANFDRIKQGMTLDEVEGIMGEYGKNDDWRGAGFLVWRAEGGCVSVYFSGDGLAQWITWYDSDETVIQKICRRLRLN